MYFKLGKSALAAAFASLLWSAQVTPANAVMVSMDIIIDDFMTTANVGQSSVAVQSGSGILGNQATRTITTGSGNTVAIGDGGLQVSAGTSFNAGISYRMDEFALDLTNEGFNNGFSIGGVAIDAVNSNNGLKWPTFDLRISVQGPDAEISPIASYLASFTPGDATPLDGNSILTLGSLFVNFNSFSKEDGFSFTDVGFITVDLFSLGDPLVTFTGPFTASVSAVPLPASLPLFLSGLAGLGVIGRRRKRKAALQA